MYNRNVTGSNSLSREFILGVEEFINFATSHPEKMDGSLVRCPCKRCDNLKFFSPNEVTIHFCQRGFVKDYYN